jgi:microcystin-dependent protein
MITRHLLLSLTALCLCLATIAGVDALARINGSQIAFGSITASHVAANAAIPASKLDPTLATQAWVTANAGGSLPTGTIIMVASSTPAGYVLCDGATYNGTQQTYSALYSAIGVTYGGTGASSFRVPDLRGRSPLGVGTGSGMTTRTMGQSGGEEAHQITIAELPAHTHATGITTGSQGYTGGNTIYSQDAGAGGRSTSSVGGNGWLSLMHPYTVIRFCIKL